MTKGALWGGTHSWYSDQTLHLGLISAQGVMGALFPPGAGALSAGLRHSNKEGNSGTEHGKREGQSHKTRLCSYGDGLFT